MTQRDLAAAVGVTESSIAQYESGRMSPRWAKADALDHTLGANGAILAAYGFRTGGPDEPDAELRSMVADMVEQVARLAEQVKDHGNRIGHLELRSR